MAGMTVEHGHVACGDASPAVPQRVLHLPRLDGRAQRVERLAARRQRGGDRDGQARRLAGEGRVDRRQRERRREEGEVLIDRAVVVVVVPKEADEEGAHDDEQRAGDAGGLSRSTQYDSQVLQRVGWRHRAALRLVIYLRLEIPNGEK